MPSPVAVIDIGSNSIKILVAARESASTPIVALKQRTIDARISAGISQATPRLGEPGMAAGLAAIRSLLADAAPFAPVRTVLVATSAVRDAANGSDFRARIAAATGHSIRILSGDEEANLIGRGLTADPALAHLRDFYVFDLGGGSLECLAFRDRQIAQALSFRLGCVRLTEKFVADRAAPLDAATRAAVAAHIRETISAGGFRFDLSGTDAIFAGGSMTTVRAILGARHGLPLDRTSPVIEADTLRQLADEISGLTLGQRQHTPGLPASRADVFPVALDTIAALADLGQIPAFRHSFQNLRWGLAAELLDL